MNKRTVKYIAVPIDGELMAAIDAGREKSGLCVGQEAARAMRKAYKVGAFAAAKGKGRKCAKRGKGAK